MALVVFGGTYLVTGSIYAAVNLLAVGERARAFKAISPGILSPLGILFGLYLAFTAAQVWGDIDRANAAVNREASALSALVILAVGFPGEPEAGMRGLVRRYIETTVARMADDGPAHCKAEDHSHRSRRSAAAGSFPDPSKPGSGDRAA
jgi:hypothetical protein